MARTGKWNVKLVVTEAVLAAVVVMGFGCSELGWFGAGLAGGLEAAKQANIEIRQQLVEAKAVREELGATLAEAKAAIKDPNETRIASLIERLNALGARLDVVGELDEESVGKMVADALEVYYQTHGTIAMVKEEAGDKSNWAGLALAITALYQKLARRKEQQAIVAGAKAPSLK